MTRKDDGDLSAFEFFKRFPNEAAAIAFLEAERWPDGAICPRCDSKRTRRIAKQNRYNCNDCRRQFSVRTGTIYQKTRIPIRYWLYAMYLIHVSRKGVSSAQLGRELGVTQKTAWFMLHRIRESMEPDLDQMKGEIEIDEAYVGGLEKNKHARKKLHKHWMEGKQVVLGFRERGEDGRILIRPIHSAKELPLNEEILFAVEEGSTLYSDTSSTYFGLQEWYQHHTVNHQKGEYVRDEVTTNSIESVWAILKRSHKGIYHQWSKKHGHRYYNEIAYRLTEGRTGIPTMVCIKKLAQKSFQVTITYRELTHE